jgi:hypothetical protein
MAKRRPRSKAAKRKRKSASPRKRSTRRVSLLRRLLPTELTKRRWRRWRNIWRVWPASVRVVLGAAVLLVLWAGLNGFYQLARKPSELFFPVSGTLYKTPSETWRTYGSLFTKHSTQTITREFLAALAQVEGSGNPLARTYWRWSLRADPFEIYRPASSAVGMYQITNGTFAEARRYCVHRHVVVEVGPWHDWRACWFNALYTRTVPGHAIEMTSAYLDRGVARILARQGIAAASLADRQNLAAAIHLCGAGAGNVFARAGLRVRPGQRCGDHDLAAYLARVESMRRAFVGIDSASSGS